MRELFPEIEKNFHNYLETDSNKIYYEESGNPNGIPVIFCTAVLVQVVMIIIDVILIRTFIGLF